MYCSLLYIIIDYLFWSHLCYFPQTNLFTGASAGPPKLSEDNNDRMRAGLLSKVSELLINIFYTCSCTM